MSQLPKVADLDDIVQWIAVKQAPNSGFAHIRGPAATDKGGTVPIAMWDEMRAACPGAKLLHVVAPFKREIMEARHKQDMATKEQSDEVPETLLTRTYEELSALLRKARSIHGWGVMGNVSDLDMETVILIEVDPNFSAQFVLALNAAVAFTASFPKQQHLARTRLATMSSEPLDPLTDNLLRQWGIATDVPTFRTSRQKINWGIESEENDWNTEERLQEAIDRVNDDQGGRCGVILFKDTVDGSLEMESILRLDLDLRTAFDLQNKRVVNFLLSKESGIVVLHHPRKRPDRPISDFNSVHIVVREFDRRPVYDAGLQQVVVREQPLTYSERLEQVVFARRFITPPERILLHHPHDYLAVDRSPPRPLDYANTQTAGLLAALAEYQHWPDLTWEGLHKWLEDQHQGVYERSLKSLEKQALFHPQPGSPNAKLNLEVAGRELFFELLSKVEYDARIAHFLVLPCSWQHLHIKVQVAAALTIGLSQLVKFEVSLEHGPQVETQFLEAVRSFAQMGVTSPVASLGTLWDQLGLVKACHHWRHDVPRPPGIEDFRDLYPEFADKVKDIARSFRSRGIETREEVKPYSEEILMSGEGYHALCKDLLKVYCTQLACVVKPPPPDNVSYIDLLSGREMKARPCDTLKVNWEYIRTKGPGSLIGFYTSLTEDPKTQDIVVDDWTWIPPEVFLEWQEEVGRRTGKNLMEYIQS